MVWLPTFLVERKSMSLLVASTLAGIVTLSGIPSMLLGTWLSDVWLGGRKKIVIFCSLVTPIPILLLLPLVQAQSLLLVLFASLFALFYSAGGLYFAYPSILVAKEQVGAASGLIDMLGYVGNFLGILIIGVMVDVSNSYDPMFLVSAVMALAGALAILKVKP